MGVQRIRLYGDPVLRKQCLPVETIDDSIRELVDDLIATVDSANGLGLAAPQIGVAKRVVVVVDVQQNGKRVHKVLINPEVVSSCGEEVSEEGCLSIPGVFAQVKRPRSVVVAGISPEGKSTTVEADGLLARALLHEIDHLDGVLFIDRIGVLRRTLLRKKLDEIRKMQAEASSAR